MGIEKQSTARELLLEVLLPAWKRNRTKVEELDDWYRGKHKKPTMPRRPTREYRELQERSVTPWLSLVVTAVAQSLYVEGYRRRQESDNAPSWDIWQRNGFDSRQVAVHRGALAHGLAYVTVLPGSPVPVLRGVSARKMVALYQDPAEDEWPMYAVRGEDLGGGRWRWRIYDDQQIWTFDGDYTSAEYVTVEEHGVGECPVVRFANMLDLDGRTPGEVEPLIPLAGRIDQDTFDRLVVQRFGSWQVRYIAGMAEPETDAERRAESIRLSVSDLLVSESGDTKFGTLPGTPLEGFIKSRDADIRDLAAVSQTPPHHLLGEVANLSAEALSAAESALTRKVEERKHSFGESHEQVFRLAAALNGEPAEDADPAAEVVWRDTGSKSLSQVADALGKLAEQLRIPPEGLWERIPGVTQSTVDRWRQLREESDPFAGLVSELNRGATSPAE